MKNFIKNALMLSVYHIARETVSNIEQEMKKEEKEKKELKHKMLLIGTVHTLLGFIYND